MELLPHVLVVGEGAARFAAEVGAEAIDLLTPEARRGWEAWLSKNVPEEVLRAWPPSELAPWARLTADPTLPRGTVNVLARDRAGHLAVAVSTSGWAWKYPGRLGDSPIIGAGCYADDDWGAAACTGMGEWTIRCSTARSVVLYQKVGLPLEAAVHEAIRDLRRLDRAGTDGWVNILALDPQEQPYGATTCAAPQFYTLWHESMANPEARQNVYLDG